MKMFYLIIFSCFLIFFAFLFFFKGNHPKITAVKINNKTVTVEVADTEAKKARGLMFRTNLNPDSGMLFLYSLEGKYSFWMANTKIPLDIIWIDKNKKIVDIKENVPPCTKTGNLLAYCTSYSPINKAKYVLEVNSYWCKNNNVKIGDYVEF